MEKLIKYRTADLMLFDDYDEALKHEEYLNTNIKEATDKIKFYDVASKELPINTDTYSNAVESFDDAYSFCEKVAILDSLSETVQKYLMDIHSLKFPSAPGVYKYTESGEWELMK